MDTTSFLARRRTAAQRSTPRRFATAAVSAIVVAGQGTSPDDPDRIPAVGGVSPIQNDSISGCEYLIVGPTS